MCFTRGVYKACLVNLQPHAERSISPHLWNVQQHCCFSDNDFEAMNYSTENTCRNMTQVSRTGPRNRKQVTFEFGCYFFLFTGQGLHHSSSRHPQCWKKRDETFNSHILAARLISTFSTTIVLESLLFASS